MPVWHIESTKSESYMAQQSKLSHRPLADEPQLLVVPCVSWRLSALASGLGLSWLSQTLKNLDAKAQWRKGTQRKTRALPFAFPCDSWRLGALASGLGLSWLSQTKNLDAKAQWRKGAQRKISALPFAFPCDSWRLSALASGLSLSWLSQTKNLDAKAQWRREAQRKWYQRRERQRMPSAPTSKWWRLRRE